MNNSDKIKNFINERHELFWYIKNDKKENIPIEFLTETILNYGNEKDVKKLFELIGIKKTAEIFYKATGKNRRINYFPEVVNYFNLYFKKYA